MNQIKIISVVFSVFNERESLPLLFSRVKEEISPLPYNFELIFVDDGSTDGSEQVIRSFTAEESSNCRMQMIRFSRNFGHEAAMTAGIDHSRGYAVICMDADLQHPPELIGKMIACFESGNDIVTMIRSRNNALSSLNNRFSTLFYKIINLLSPVSLKENAYDFFLVSGKVAAILRSNFRERNRFLRGIVQTLGFPHTSLEYAAPARVAGKTKYPFLKLSALTLQALVSFSKTPLFLGIWFGFLFALLSLILGIYTLSIFLFGTTPPSGYTTIVLFLSLSFSILFFLIGIIGIYIGYLFDEQKQRPLYLVKEFYGETFEEH